MFKNIKIDSEQCLNGIKLDFEPDSSPMAWEHYRKYYSFPDYDFDNLCFYNHCKEVKNKYFVNKPKSEGNRLYALAKNTIIENGFCESTTRLGGDTDFNFNNKKAILFRRIIGNDSGILAQLDRCVNKHHTLVNFSLMQAMGDMQGQKGEDPFDRFDVFVFNLDRFFSGLPNNILNSSRASDSNKKHLSLFLKQKYNNVYDYMRKTYFIKNEALVDKIIAQGAMEIKTKDDVVRYMNLAEEVWNTKEFYFLNKEFITIGDYFKDGGETYTLEELLLMLERDLGYSAEDGKILVRECVEQGYIVACGSGVYTR